MELVSNMHPRLPYAKIAIQEPPSALQCCAIRIQSGRATFIGTYDQTDQYEAMQWLVTVLNTDILPTLPSVSNLDGYYPIGKEGMFLHGFCWSTVMSCTDQAMYGNRILLVPDMRFHYPENRMRWLHVQEQDIPTYDHTYIDFLTQYDELKFLTSICSSRVYSAISKLLYQHYHHYVPFQESPSIKPYFWVTRSDDGNYQLTLITNTTDPDQLKYENTVVETITRHILPYYPLDFSGYYPLYDSMFPIPKTNPLDVIVIQQGDYGSWMQSIQWPAKFIVSNDTNQYWFSHVFHVSKTHMQYPHSDLSALYEQGDTLRWNAVTASKYVTREKAIAYIKSFMEKINAEKVTFAITIPSPVNPIPDLDPDMNPGLNPDA